MMLVGTIMTGGAKNDDGTAIILISLLLIIISFFSFMKLSKAEVRKTEEFNINYRKYEEELAIYEIEYLKYVHLKKIQDDPSFQLMNLAFNISNAIKSTTKPSFYLGNTKKGITEDYFFKYLKSYFDENVFDNLTIDKYKNSNIPQIETLRKYHPDFVFYDNNTGVCIDIEVDEPYVGSNGQPIHYINSNDTVRDQFFLNNNWIIIRFTEKQVFKFPDECCKAIAKMAKIYAPSIIDFEKFYNVGDLPKDKQWTRDEAHELAFKRYRQTYLSQEYIERIQEEELDSDF